MPSLETLAPALHTDRLILRGHRAEDFDASAAMWADPDVVALISGKPSTKEQSWTRLLSYSGHWLHLGFGFWVVECKKTATFLGEVGFADRRRNTLPNLDGTPEAGWVFKTDAHGQGYATEAVTRMLEWADERLEYNQTSCIFDPEHSGSIKVAEKAGFSNKVLGTYGALETLFMWRTRKVG
ncbi:N-acetyltransferase [Tateyamaria omphalii]|uniref:GNAT family N-acetyltransferase n=1 Tax=Tateyamaria omphalii TaxID=299262 RepID=UPI001677906C|nr:GNAT family N-acetyltransferase [Tateyamaria omphalii]GGX52322.1 N-acetyltransferase [Tateyamaria omphalii]